MTCLIDAARLRFAAARARGMAVEAAAAYADELIHSANPLELRRSLLTEQREDLQGLLESAKARKLWPEVREYRHQISRVDADLAIIEHMTANVQAEAAQ
jgi:hypothetical protein